MEVGRKDNEEGKGSKGPAHNDYCSISKPSAQTLMLPSPCQTTLSPTPLHVTLAPARASCRVVACGGTRGGVPLVPQRAFCIGQAPLIMGVFPVSKLYADCFVREVLDCWTCASTRNFKKRLVSRRLLPLTPH